MTRIEIFDRIIEKHDEYVQCVQHINLRAESDVRAETVPLMNQAIKEGHNGKDFKKYLFKSKSNPLLTKSNPFLSGVISYLNRNHSPLKLR
jgi:hypothetical protein